MKSKLKSFTRNVNESVWKRDELDQRNKKNNEKNGIKRGINSFNVHTNFPNWMIICIEMLQYIKDF